MDQSDRRKQQKIICTPLKKAILNHTILTRFNCEGNCNCIRDLSELGENKISETQYASFAMLPCVMYFILFIFPPII